MAKTYLSEIDRRLRDVLNAIAFLGNPDLPRPEVPYPIAIRTFQNILSAYNCSENAIVTLEVANQLVWHGNYQQALQKINNIQSIITLQEVA